MPIIDILSPYISLASLIALCVFFVVKCKMPAGVAPLVSLCAAILWFGTFGMLNILQIGGWAWFILCAALLVFTLEYKPAGNDFQKLKNPAFIFFIVAAILGVTYLAVRQPMLHEWDEFSFWGISVKMIQTQKVMYPFGDIGWPWVGTQMPALTLAGYFTQVLGGFAAWKIYAGYALLYFAVVAAVISTLGKKNISLSAAIGFIALLAPWFLTVYARQYVTHLVWLGSYGEIPSGMLLGGSLATYFSLREEKKPLWPFAITLAMLGFVKEHILPFALLAAAIAAIDLLLFADKAKNTPKLSLRAKEFFKPTKAKSFTIKDGETTLLYRISASVMFFVSAVTPFLLWRKYTAPAIAQSATGGGMGQTSPDIITVLINCFKMMIGAMPRTAQFTIAMDNMLAEFFSFRFFSVAEDGSRYFDFAFENKSNMIGGNITIVLFILAIFTVAAIAAGKGKKRKRTIVAMVLSTLGFVAYYIELIFSYAAMFKMADAEGLSSYNRYVYAYYIGWFILAVFFLAFALKDTRKDSLLRGVAFAICLLMVVRVPMLLPLENSDIGYPDAYFAEQQEYERISQNVLAAIPEENPRIFFAHQYYYSHLGEEWFIYSYHLLPAVLDYSDTNGQEKSGGGGGVPIAAPGIDDTYYEQVTAKQLRDYLSESGCDYMFVPYMDEQFMQSYGQMFTDGGQGALYKTTLLYRIVGEGDSLILEPVEMEM